MRESRYSYFVIISFYSIISNLLFNPLNVSLSCFWKKTLKKTIKDTKEASIDVEMNQFYTSTPRLVKMMTNSLVGDHKVAVFEVDEGVL